MTTCLGKSCSFGLPRVPFVNCCRFMYLVISLLVLRAGCGIWLYQFLIIACRFTYNGKNDVSTFSRLFLIRSFLYLQVTRTCIKSRIWPDRITDYGVSCPWCLKISHRFIMEKWCLHASSFIFDRIIMKVADNQDRHKSSDEFDFGPLASHYCPLLILSRGQCARSVTKCHKCQRNVFNF